MEYWPLAHNIITNIFVFFWHKLTSIVFYLVYKNYIFNTFDNLIFERRIVRFMANLSFPTMENDLFVVKSNLQKKIRIEIILLKI